MRFFDASNMATWVLDMAQEREIKTTRKSQKGTYLNFGWEAEHERSDEQNHINHTLVTAMPAFAAPPITDKPPKRLVLTDIWKQQLGEEYVVFWQKTGSCVGNGAGQSGTLTNAMEKFMLGEAQAIKILSYLMPYGMGRKLGGMDKVGEGSFGSAQAEALKKYGMYEINEPGMEPFENKGGGLTYGAQVEKRWSHGSWIERNKGEFIELGKKHLFGQASQMHSVDDVKHSILKGCACTIASNRGFKMTARPRSGALVLPASGVWNHQMSFIGYWEHDSLGDLIAIINNWGPTAHGTCPSGLVPGAFWCTREVAQYMIKQKECFSIGMYNGYPEANILKLTDYMF